MEEDILVVSVLAAQSSSQKGSLTSLVVVHSGKAAAKYKSKKLRFH